MYNLIKADLFKLRKSMAIKILLLITASSSIIMTIIAYMVQQGKLNTSSTNIGFLFSDANMMGILGGALAAIFICNDFDNRTIHEAIVDGNSREKVVTSKAVILCLSSLIILLPYVIVTGIAISTGNKFNMGLTSVGFLKLLTTEGGSAISLSQVWKMVAIIFALLASYAARASVCIPLAIALKKPSIVVPAYYGLTIFLAKLSSLEASSKLLKNIFQCTPFSGKYSLMTLNTGESDIIKAIVLSLIFIAIITFITGFAFRKSEIK